MKLIYVACIIYSEDMLCEYLIVTEKQMSQKDQHSFLYSYIYLVPFRQLKI